MIKRTIILVAFLVLATPCCSLEDPPPVPTQKIEEGTENLVLEERQGTLNIWYHHNAKCNFFCINHQIFCIIIKDLIYHYKDPVWGEWSSCRIFAGFCRRMRDGLSGNSQASEVEHCDEGQCPAIGKPI